MLTSVPEANDADTDEDAECGAASLPELPFTAMLPRNRTATAPAPHARHPCFFFFRLRGRLRCCWAFGELRGGVGVGVVGHERAAS